MKPYLFICYSLLFLNYSYSQGDYYSLIESEKSWNVSHSAFPNWWSTETLKIMEDTVINGITYSILNTSSEQFPSNWLRAGYMREDSNQRVFYSHHDPSGVFNEEKLLYDFSVSEGDTLTINNYTHGVPMEVEVVVDSTDSVFVVSDYRKRLHIHTEWFAYTRPWIEGIGSGDGLLYTGVESVIIDMGSSLLCVRKEDTLYYMLPPASSCYVSSVNINEDNLYAMELIVNPNPFTTSTTLSYTLDKPNNVQITIYTLQGQIVERFEMEQPNGPQQIQWNAEGLPPGLYIIRLQAGNNIAFSKLLLAH